MEWFLERNGSREGPYQAVEVAARVTAGSLPAETPVVSTTGELRLTAGALIAASATAAPAESAVQAVIPPSPPHRRAWLRAWLCSIRSGEWVLGSLVIIGFVLACCPVPWFVIAIPMVASIAAIIIDYWRNGLSRLALAKLPLSRMERWPLSTWATSATILWPIYAPLYLLKRRRLIACAAEADRAGTYASITDMRDAHRGVAGAALVAAQAPQHRRDLLLQVGCGIVGAVVVCTAIFAPWPARGSASTTPSASSAAESVLAAMRAYVRAFSGTDVDESLAEMEQVDVSGCPSDFQSAYEDHRQVLRDWAAKRRSLAAAAQKPMHDDVKIFVQTVSTMAAKEYEDKIQSTYAELMRVAGTYGVTVKTK